MQQQSVRTLGDWWGIAGVSLLLTFAIFRLAPHALDTFHHSLTTWQWLALIVWCAFMVYSEGYDGFYKRLAPRLLERAATLKKKGSTIEILLAPLYCLHYFRASRQRMIVAYTAIILIVAAVISVHQLPQPWRGLIDCGVILGLLGGIGAIALRLRESRQK